MYIFLRNNQIILWKNTYRLKNSCTTLKIVERKNYFSRIWRLIMKYCGLGIFLLSIPLTHQKKLPSFWLPQVIPLLIQYWHTLTHKTTNRQTLTDKKLWIHIIHTHRHTQKIYICTYKNEYETRHMIRLIIYS